MSLFGPFVGYIGQCDFPHPSFAHPHLPSSSPHAEHSPLLIHLKPKFLFCIVPLSATGVNLMQLRDLQTHYVLVLEPKYTVLHRLEPVLCCSKNMYRQVLDLFFVTMNGMYCTEYPTSYK
jgi:hypothetical protein